MNQAIPSCLLSIGLVATASAVEPIDLASNPAKIEALLMEEVPLRASDEEKGWVQIPEVFSKCHATIFKPDRDKLGVARFEVVEEGYLLIAVNYDYQGNRSGDWTTEMMTLEQLQQDGWRELELPAAGGALVQGDGREQTILYRMVHEGERYSLCCNKYDPPYPILLHRWVVADTGRSP